MLCTIDQEVFCEPCQPISTLGDPASDFVGPVYAIGALNYAAGNVQAFCQGYRLRPQEMGNNCGAVAGTCGVNLRNGNLVLSFCLPGAGPADPPIRFYYNSQSIDDSEYGFGWTGLYRQWIETAGSSSSSSSASRTWLTSLFNPAGMAWRIERDPLDGRVLSITDPYKKKTQFDYSGGGRLTKVTDSGGRATTFVINNDGQLEKITSPANEVTVLAYDEENLLTGWTNQQGHKTVFAYDDCMRLKSIRTPENEVTRYQYIEDDPAQRVVTNALNYPTTITLDDYGNVNIVQEPESITTTYTWDALQRLQAFVDGRGKTTSFDYKEMADLSKRIEAVNRPLGTLTLTYDSATGRLTSITDPNNNSTALAWNVLETDHYPGVVVTLTNADSNNYIFGYNDAGQIGSLTDPLTHTTAWTFDGRGRRRTVTNAQSETTTFAYDSKNRLNAVTDPTGQTTNMILDDDNRVESITDPNIHSTWFEYDGNGRLRVTENALFKKWTQTYDKDGRLKSEIDPEGNTSQYAYYPTGTVKSVTNPRSKTTIFTYDGVNRLEAARDPLNRVTTYTYDAASNVKTVKNPDNKVWTCSYDDNNRLTATQDPNTNTTARSYKPAGNLESVTDQLSHTTTFTYTSLNQLDQVENAENEFTTYGYDDAGRLTSVANNANKIFTYTYYDSNRIRSIEDPEGHKTTYTYNLSSRYVEVEDANTHVTKMQFDPAGRQQYTVNARGYTFSYDYDAANRMTKLTTPSGVTIGYGYDFANRPISMTNGAGETYVTAYDANSNVQSVTSPEGRRVTFVYDNADQTENIINPRGYTTTYDYTTAGYLESVTDPESKTTTYVYDPAGRMTDIVNANGDTLSYDLDTAGRVTTFTDPCGHDTTYAYDNVNRPMGATNAEGNTVTFVRDTVGRVKNVIDAESRTSTITYDDLGRVTGRQYQDGDIYTISYDNVGNLKTTAGPAGNFTFTYDAGNLPLTKLDPTGKTTTYTFDSDGVFTNRRVEDIGTYTYDPDPTFRVKTVTGPDSLTTTLGYDEDGLVTRRELPNGVVASMSYDPAGNLHVIEHRDSSNALISGYTYTYDKSNHATQVEDADGSITTWTYDNIYQLEREHRQVGAAVIDWCSMSVDEWSDLTPDQWAQLPVCVEPYDISRVYSACGNILTRTASPPVTYTYDDANRLLKMETDAGTYTMTYDANGLRQTLLAPGGIVTTYTWDDAHLLRRVDFPAGSTFSYVEYDYQPDGLLAKQETNLSTIHFLWDGPILVAELDASNNVKRWYVQENYILREHDEDSNEDKFALLDGTGNVRQTVDDAEAVTGTQDFTAFGQEAGEDVGEHITGFTYLGGRGYFHDTSTGLYFDGRTGLWYDPAVERYLTPNQAANNQFSFGGSPKDIHERFDSLGRNSATLMGSSVSSPSGPLGPVVRTMLPSVIDPISGIGFGTDNQLIINTTVTSRQDWLIEQLLNPPTSPHGLELPPLPPRMMGGLQALGGAVQVAGGTYYSLQTAGLGAFIGGSAAIGFGINNLGAGISTLISGEPVETPASRFTRGLSNDLFGTPLPGQIAYVTGDIGTGFWAAGSMPLSIGGGGTAINRSKISDWFKFRSDLGGATYVVGEGAQYSGRLSWLNRIGLRRGYSTRIINKDISGSWFARTDTGVHEVFHAWIAENLPTVWKVGDLRIARIPVGAPVKYLEEVMAYSVGHAASLRLHGIPFTPIEAFGSLSSGERATTIVFAIGGYGTYQYISQ